MTVGEDPSPTEVDAILLATGFIPRRPGGPLIDRLVADLDLACADCGYPIVDEALRWHPRLFVSGPLAELEVGPVARNIVGARRAADRIVDAVEKPHRKRGFADPPPRRGRSLQRIMQRLSPRR